MLLRRLARGASTQDVRPERGGDERELRLDRHVRRRVGRGARRVREVAAVAGMAELDAGQRRAGRRHELVGNVATAQFIAAPERVSGQQLDAFFDVWLYQPVKPTSW